MNKLNNILNNIEPLDVINGMTWYDQARREAHRLADKYDVDFCRVAAIISALSPANYWQQNLKDSENVLIEYRTGLRAKVATYNQNRLKALRILESNDAPLSFFTALKTRAFYLNIVNPSSEDVVIDRHMAKILLGWTLDKSWINKTQYRKAAKIVKNLAYKLGFKPYELQAILWCTIKRVNNK
jgi:hypothetical protein